MVSLVARAPSNTIDRELLSISTENPNKSILGTIMNPAKAKRLLKQSISRKVSLKRDFP